MPEQQISNSGGLYGLTGEANPDIKYMVNGSAGTLLPGDVVVFSGVAGTTVTTSATLDDPTVIGVVGAQDNPNDSLRTAASTDTYAVGAVMPVVVRGPARINIAANAVAAAGALLGQSAVAKVAATNAAPVSGDTIAVAMEAAAAKDANNTIRAWIQKL